MDFLTILTMILKLLPAGIQGLQDILALIASITALFNSGAVPAAQQQAVVEAIAAHIAKK